MRWTVLPLALVTAALLAPLAPASAGGPYTHPCSGTYDTHCLWGPTGCDYYVHVATVTRCQQTA